MAAALVLLLLLAPLLVDDAHGAVAFEDDAKAGESPDSDVRDAAAFVCAPKHAACKSDGIINPGQYGPVEKWDTSKLTWLGAAFHNPLTQTTCSDDEKGHLSFPSKFDSDLDNIGRFCGTFDADIGGWDVAAATSLVYMFDGATQFNADIGRWDVSLVEGMQSIFNLASGFNANLASWQVSLVTNLRDAFNTAVVFDQNIAGWDVRKLKDYNDAFRSAMSFTQDLLPWVKKAPPPENANDGSGRDWVGLAPTGLDPTCAGITMLNQAYAPKHDLALRPEVLPGQTARACARVPTSARAHLAPCLFLGQRCAQRRHCAPFACRPQSVWRGMPAPHKHTLTCPFLAWHLSCCPPAAAASGEQRNTVR